MCIECNIRKLTMLSIGKHTGALSGINTLLFTAETSVCMEEVIDEARSVSFVGLKFCINLTNCGNSVNINLVLLKDIM